MKHHELIAFRDAGQLDVGAKSSVPRSIFDVPAMLIEGERVGFYNVVRHLYEGIGEIVDLGCLVGGSTVCFGRALLDRGETPARRIHSYDLFVASAYIREFLRLPADVHTTGDLFRRHIEPMRDHVQVYAGDVAKIGWNGRPIEILFVDCAKTWELTDAIRTDFFRSLIPGRSLLIQQDFLFHMTPWLFVQMELLAPFFEFVHSYECNTAYFFHTRRIPDELLQVDVRGMWASDKLELLDAACVRYAETPVGPWAERAREFFRANPDPTLRLEG